MRSLDFGTPKHVVKSVFYEVLISVRVRLCACIYVCVFMGGERGEVGILIVLSSAGEGNVKIALGGIYHASAIYDRYFHFAYSHVQYYRWGSSKQVLYSFVKEGYQF